jgi:pimeloyl-ACP methyl ester carboxylesterase
MIGSHAPRTAIFTGAEGNRLRADVFGEQGRPVLLLHGGGQTRHAWRRTAGQLARAGWVAYALDQRGHGDSDWVESGAYTFGDFAADAAIVADELAARHGTRPVSVGASLGGIASLMAEGMAQREGREAVFAILVLVDVTPRVDGDGVARIRGFMGARAREGFATIAEAADLPHRPRPRSYDGLRKNLRFHPDGRWRWHWDPRFLEGTRNDPEDVAQRELWLSRAARGLKMPVLLVRGGSSEVVGENHLREFLTLVPHAQYADVAGARHMVAGDNNDRFAAAMLTFLTGLRAADQPAARADDTAPRRVREPDMPH